MSDHRILGRSETLAEKRERLLTLMTKAHQARARRESTHFEFIDRPPPRMSDIAQMPEALVDQLLRRHTPRTADRPRYVW